MSAKNQLQPLTSPISIAMFDYIAAADRPVPFDELVGVLNHMPADEKGRTPSQITSMYVKKLLKHRIDNINPRRNEVGIYVLSQLALDHLSAGSAQQPQAEPAPEPQPAWVGQVAAPRQYDVMDPNNVYVPPPILCRGGKSIREELEEHPTRQASYIPAL